MDEQQNLDSQSLKDRPWTTDEIRKSSSNWTLAGDVGLFNLLNKFSHEIISRTHEVENAMDSLVHQTKMTSAKINNVINDFHMLSNMQFVENRVYDEDVQEQVPENKPVTEKTKEQREAEMLPKILQAIELGLGVLDTAFERINVNEISDSEDEDISSEGHTILEPKDPYEQRPLPYIIGSEQFMKCDFAGLKDLVEEDVQSFSEESSISETDETSSEGEPLPLDDDDDKFLEKQNDRMFQNLNDRISSSDESELFASEKEVNGYASDSSLEFKPKEKNIQKVAADAEPQKETRQSSVSSLQSKLKLPQVLPVPKPQGKKNDDSDLFTNEDDLSDDESPFRKKTGLFSSDVRFKDEKDGDLFDDDLFGKSPRDDLVQEIKSEVSKPSSKKPQSASVLAKKKPILFDNDEDSEDDIFNTLMKAKKPSPKINNVGSQDSSEKADTSSTPSSAPSTKPSGNAFDFVTGAGNNNLFGDDSDGDDLFSTKKTSEKKFGFDNSESDDLFGIISAKGSKESKGLGDKSPLFEDKISDKPEPKKSLLVKKKTKDSIFEDSDSSDQEKKIPVLPPLSAAAPLKKKTEMSLFDDDDDDMEDDIFRQAKKETTIKKDTQQSSLFTADLEQVEDKKLKTVKSTDQSKTLSLFDDTDEGDSLEFEKTVPVKSVDKSKNTIFFDDVEKSNVVKSEPVKPIPTKPSLFEDDLEKEPSPSPAVVPKSDQTKTLSLFEDSDSFDLFAPKPSAKKNETAAPAQISKPAVEKHAPEIKDDIDGITISKISSPVKVVNTDSHASFDVPVDSSNVLNVINKGRVKVTAKRRKPTRHGRLAALENADKEDKDVEPSSTKLDLGSTEDNSDSLFTSTVKKSEEQTTQPAKLDYKAQEKKKMNLMSQLISEVATTKIGLKLAVEKEAEEEEEDIDIFSEAARKDKSKGSFSFRPPEENAIASIFPIEKKEEKNELDLSKSDSFEDDFFTEPAFQNFRSSISHKDPVLDLEDDDDDDDDLFSAIKSTALPKAKPESDSNDLFDDDTDIFADIHKEKYEMFPSQIYDDEDDDIFGNVTNTVTNKPLNNSSTSKNTSSVKKIEKQQVNVFEDPLTGLLGED